MKPRIPAHSRTNAGKIGKDGVDLSRDPTVNLEAWRHEHQFGTAPHGGCRGHGGVDTVYPGLVARCGHHASLGAMANRDRATPKVSGLSRCSTDA
jgi:hypothetical protein